MSKFKIICDNIRKNNKNTVHPHVAEEQRKNIKIFVHYFKMLIYKIPKEMFFMLGLIRRNKTQVTDRTVYMEIYGANRVTYRVTSGRISAYGNEIMTYGIEAVDFFTGESESIPDFSCNIEDAVDFAEILISDRVKPDDIYGKALAYLSVSI